MSYKTDKFDEELIRLLESGGIGVMPSDTIYGLSCQALKPDSVNKIYILKKRASNKSFVVLSSFEDVNQLATEDSLKIAKKYWPASLTVVLKSIAPEYLNSIDGTIAVRVPNNTELLNLLVKTGPLISTSANLSGLSPVKNINEAYKIFGEKVDFYVDGGELDGPPSTIAKILNDRLTVIRQGAYIPFAK